MLINKTFENLQTSSCIGSYVWISHTHLLGNLSCSPAEHSEWPITKMSEILCYHITIVATSCVLYSTGEHSHTVYCKLFEVESFTVAELNCNLLENIHSWTVVLHGQGLLQRLFHWKSFAVTDRSTKIVNLFHLKRFSIWYIRTYVCRAMQFD